MSENKTTGPEAPKPCGYARADVEFVLEKMIEICADFFHGYDLVEDAVNIAKLVICDAEDENTAQQILMSMGYLTWLMADWRGLTPETTAKLEQIRDLNFPDLNFDN